MQGATIPAMRTIDVVDQGRLISCSFEEMADRLMATPAAEVYDPADR